MSAPTTVQGLTAWFEKAFCCIEGPPRAFIELHCGPDPESMVRYVYATHAVRVDGDCPHCAERLLVQALYEDFAPLVYRPEGGTLGGTVLFWRKKPELTRDVAPIFGEVLATREMVEDGLKREPNDVAVMQDEDGNWRQLLGERRGWTLRTRLSIPAMIWNPNPMKTALTLGSVVLTVT